MHSYFDLLVLAELDQLAANVAPQQPRVVLDVVGERWAQPPDGKDGEPHYARY